MKSQLPTSVLTRTLFICFAILLCLPSLYSQKKKKPRTSIFEALQHKQIVGVIIETDLDSLINHRNRDTYQKGTFSYTNSKGKVFNHRMKLRPRGKFRRRICDFPMVKIDFPKKVLKEHGYSKYDDYKLVTHCLNNAVMAYDNIAREFLVYKLYNILTPNSYQVQFLYFTYVDSKKKIPTIQQIGFIIEDTAELEDRVYGEVRKETAGLLQDSFNIQQHDFVALFQYMIGNTDWTAYPIPRNVKAIKYVEEKKHKLVPFDFDFSGFVAAPYAVPRVSLNQRSIRQRIFQGISKDPETLQPTIKHFLSKKKKILRAVKQYDFLSKHSKKDILNFIKPFFEDLEKGYPWGLKYPKTDMANEKEETENKE